MKQDIILSGVGGQGILSIAFVLDNAALLDGLNFKQAEVHGMSQRGGAVQSHLRLSDQQIHSDLVPRGMADMILSVEPLEALRYVNYLSGDGKIITSSTPYMNIPDYPDIEEVLEKVREINKPIIVDSKKLAAEAGSTRAQNMVMLGAASSTLIVKEESLIKFIEVLFKPKGQKLVDMNHRAFELGKKAATEQS